MADPGEGVFLAFLDPYVPLLLGLLIATLLLFARWLENADRSAYIVGTAAAILTPAWVVVTLALRFATGHTPLLPQGLEHEPLLIWGVGWAFWGVGLVLVLALLWFTLRPLWLTGLFLLAPQGQVRRRYKSLESSWQFALATLVAVKAFSLLYALLALWL